MKTHKPLVALPFVLSGAGVVKSDTFLSRRQARDRAQCWADSVGCAVTYWAIGKRGLAVGKETTVKPRNQVINYLPFLSGVSL